MDNTGRARQQRYRQRRKEASLHRLDVYVPQDVMDGIARRWKPYGDTQNPAMTVIKLLRRAMRLPSPEFPTPSKKEKPDC